MNKRGKGVLPVSGVSQSAGNTVHGQNRVSNCRDKRERLRGKAEAILVLLSLSL